MLSISNHLFRFLSTLQLFKKLRRLVGGKNSEQRTEDVGNVWPTAGTHPEGPGGCLPRCLFLHTALCRSHQTFAALAGTPLCQTPAGQENSRRVAVSPTYLSAPSVTLCDSCVLFYLGEKYSVHSKIMEPLQALWGYVSICEQAG